MTLLADRVAKPVAEGTPPLADDVLRELQAQLDPHWAVENSRLQRKFSFANFADALGFAVRVGMLAEGANHHPELTVRWGEVVVELWTHTVHGLAEIDFVLAARCDRLA